MESRSERIRNRPGEVGKRTRLLRDERRVLTSIDSCHVDGEVEQADRVGGLVVVEGWEEKEEDVSPAREAEKKGKITNR